MSSPFEPILHALVCSYEQLEMVGVEERAHLVLTVRDCVGAPHVGVHAEVAVHLGGGQEE